VTEAFLGFPQSFQANAWIVTWTAYSLTPWRRILFENLIVTQLVKQQPSFFMEPEGYYLVHNSYLLKILDHLPIHFKMSAVERALVNNLRINQPFPQIPSEN
jgi:hypothetical protein